MSNEKKEVIYNEEIQPYEAYNKATSHRSKGWPDWKPSVETAKPKGNSELARTSKRYSKYSDKSMYIVLMIAVGILIVAPIRFIGYGYLAFVAFALAVLFIIKFFMSKLVAQRKKRLAELSAKERSAEPGITPSSTALNVKRRLRISGTSADMKVPAFLISCACAAFIGVMLYTVGLRAGNRLLMAGSMFFAAVAIIGITVHTIWSIRKVD